MIMITCRNDLIHAGGKMPAPFAGVTKRELIGLLDLLDSERSNPGFRIDTAGYRIVCLEHKETENELASIGLAHPFHQVEYVEVLEVYKMQFYRILLMHDNECFTIILSPRDSQNAALEVWFREQSGYGEE